MTLNVAVGESSDVKTFYVYEGIYGINVERQQYSQTCGTEELQTPCCTWRMSSPGAHSLQLILPKEGFFLSSDGTARRRHKRDLTHSSGPDRAGTAQFIDAFLAKNGAAGPSTSRQSTVCRAARHRALPALKHAHERTDWLLQACEPYEKSAVSHLPY